MKGFICPPAVCNTPFSSLDTLFVFCWTVCGRTMSEWSSSSKGRRGETSMLLKCLKSPVETCSPDLWPPDLFLSVGFCSFLALSSWTTWGLKPKWLSARWWTFTTPTMRYKAAHFKLLILNKMSKIYTPNLCFSLFAAGDSTDDSGWPGQGRGAAGSQRSHEEPEDPPGAADVLSGQQLSHPRNSPSFIIGHNLLLHRGTVFCFPVLFC